ncbi:PLP-dependent aminotransferase family protein [Agrobacterium vitis]|uniref:aminotransferase-like domain-containing protein n=2 Tax=Agrobacterium vitis TaxID=373 RepID=UPI0031F39283|nr:PLP-dependent aminotransferase family protein [Agrobacterium vitis]WEO75272.1 PLP-dependent aminotransferase family protein [Agrobacterium vitis]
MMDINGILGSVRLDKASEVPMYAQVRDTLLTAISNGQIAVGTRLPPVRKLASSLDVNLMTVARAYKEMTEQGVIAGRGALGTFVTGQAKPPEEALPVKAGRESYSVRDDDTFARMLQFSGRPGVIPFTRAYPDASTVDVASFEANLMQVISSHPEHAYSYIQPDGLYGLKVAFSTLMKTQRNLLLDPESILVSSGGQQALSLVAQSVLKAGDTVIVERPTYFGALDLFRTLGVKVLGVRMEKDGMDIEELEHVVSTSKPKLLFLIPTFHNPTGITTSLEKRRAILEISRRYGVAILEDDCCSELRYVGSSLPSIKALSEPLDEIYYFSSMGKAYIPGLRLGMVAPPRSRLGDIVKQKSVADLHTSPLLQNAFQLYLESGAYKASLSNTCDTYRNLLDKICDELAAVMPAGASFMKPDGGLNIWLNLPVEVDSIDFFYACLQRNVSVLVGRHFYPDSGETNTIRLSFGHSDQQTMVTAVAAMGDAARELQGRTSLRFPVLV